VTHDDVMFSQGVLIGLVIGWTLTESWYHRRYVMYRRKQRASKNGKPCR